TATASAVLLCAGVPLPLSCHTATPTESETGGTAPNLRQRRSGHRRHRLRCGSTTSPQQLLGAWRDKPPKQLETGQVRSSHECA
ncbi:unnamed protein product, partial [Ectocarpus sp. 6 AP-2014]